MAKAKYSLRGNSDGSVFPTDYFRDSAGNSVRKFALLTDAKTRAEEAMRAKCDNVHIINEVNGRRYWKDGDKWKSSPV